MCRRPFVGFAAGHLSGDGELWRHRAGLSVVATTVGSSHQRLAGCWATATPLSPAAAAKARSRRRVILKFGQRVPIHPVMTFLDIDTLGTALARPDLVIGTLCVAALVAAGLFLRQRRRAHDLARTVEALTSRLGETDLPGLPALLGRERFDAAMDLAAARCDLSGQAFCVLFVGLDHLQELNDVDGYDSGDRAIARAAQLLDCVGGRSAPLTRVGGGAFLLLLEGDIALARTMAALIVQRVLHFDQGEPAGQLAGCSVGIASYPAHGSRSRLVSHASAAMRQVRQAGGNHYAEFDPAMAVNQRDQAELLRDLRHAVERNQLQLVYQPKVDAASLQITAAEALLRWHHPERGLISPAQFIPMAERAGLIASIGDWVITEACRQAGVWRVLGLRMRVAINISAYQMRQDDLVDRIEAALQRNGLSASRFTLEITESVAMEDTRVTQRSFERMRRAGLHVSIDDFGVGQASLSYLRRLPAAELKIDASFVQDLDSSADARAIVDAVIKLAHALNLRVVAEGVETEAQRDHLRNLDCDEMQGFLFARLMSARALSLWATPDADTSTATGFRSSLFLDSVLAPP